jgi:hypothetical protein
LSDLSRYAIRGTKVCKHCGKDIFYSAPDCNYLHVKAESGNHFYCKPGDIGGPNANSGQYE